MRPSGAVAAAVAPGHAIRAGDLDALDRLMWRRRDAPVEAGGGGRPAGPPDGDVVIGLPRLQAVAGALAPRMAGS